MYGILNYWDLSFGRNLKDEEAIEWEEPVFALFPVSLIKGTFLDMDN